MPEAPEDDSIETRGKNNYVQDPATGQMRGSRGGGGGIRRKKGGPKYEPHYKSKKSSERLGITKKDYGVLRGLITSKFGDNLQPGYELRSIGDAHYRYIFSVADYGDYTIHKKILLKKK